MIINDKLLDKISTEAKENSRLRMNYNLHTSLDSKTQRLLNALEIGTVLPIHRHPHTDETYILLRGQIDVLFYDDAGLEIECFELDSKIGTYGIQIPMGQWHTVKIKVSSVIFEVKEGPYRPLKPEDILY